MPRVTKIIIKKVIRIFKSNKNYCSFFETESYAILTLFLWKFSRSLIDSRFPFIITKDERKPETRLFQNFVFRINFYHHITILEPISLLEIYKLSFDCKLPHMIQFNSDQHNYKTSCSAQNKTSTKSPV